MSNVRLMQVLDKIQLIVGAYSRDLTGLRGTLAKYYECVSLSKPTTYEPEYVRGKFIDVQRSLDMLCEYFEELGILEDEENGK